MRAKLEQYSGIIADAINVKEVVLTADVASFGSRDIKVNSKLGARIGAKFKEVLAAQRARTWVMRPDGKVEIAGIILDTHDFELRLQAMEDVVAEPFDAWRGVVVLDTRDSIRNCRPKDGRGISRGWCNRARKQAGFNVTDRVEIVASVAPELEHALREFKTYVTGETLAVRFDLVAKGALGSHGKAVEEEIDGYHVAFVVTRMAA